MKNLLTPVVALLCLVLCACRKNVGSISMSSSENANSYDLATETSPPIYKYIYTTIGTDVKSGYAEILPSLYYQTTKRYPLIIFNHGIGENQNQGTTTRSLSSLSCCGIPYYGSRKTFPAKFYNSLDGKYYSYIVVAPQYYNRPTASQVNEVVNYAISKYRVDVNRIYVVGLSQGGGNTMDWAASYGEKAAAIFPSCPGLSPSSTKAQMIASKNLPIWWTYGDKDNLVPYSQGQKWQSLIDGYNSAYASKTILQLYTSTSYWTASHNNTWAKAFNPATKFSGKNAYEWLLQYTRDGNIPPQAVVVGGDRSIPLSWNYYATVWGTSSKDTDGWITKFKWLQIGGPASTINSPTSGSTKLITPTAGIYTYQLTVTDNKGATANKLFKITMQ